MKPDLRLMVITDGTLAAPRSVTAVVEACLQAGAAAVQLRDKGADTRQLLEQARALRKLTAEYDALLVVNDRLDVALLAEADGVHLGPDDIPVAGARRVAPAGFIIGFSTDDPATAARAQSDGASYIGCGAVFGTTTKAGLETESIGPEGVSRAAGAVSIPVIAIGGIDSRNIVSLKGSGAAGVAVVGALMGSPDPGAMTRELLAAVRGWSC